MRVLNQTWCIESRFFLTNKLWDTILMESRDYGFVRHRGMVSYSRKFHTKQLEIRRRVKWSAVKSGWDVPANLIWVWILSEQGMFAVVPRRGRRTLTSATRWKCIKLLVNSYRAPHRGKIDWPERNSISLSFLEFGKYESSQRNLIRGFISQGFAI